MFYNKHFCLYFDDYLNNIDFNNDKLCFNENFLCFKFFGLFDRGICRQFY